MAFHTVGRRVSAHIVVQDVAVVGNVVPQDSRVAHVLPEPLQGFGRRKQLSAVHLLVVDGIHRIVFFAEFGQNRLVGTYVEVERFAHNLALVQSYGCYFDDVVGKYIQPRSLRIEHYDVAIVVVLQEVGGVVAVFIQQEVGWRERQLAQFVHETAGKTFGIEHLQPFQ